MKSNSLYRLIFDNCLSKICDINSYCHITLKTRKTIIYCFAYNNDTLFAYNFDGIIGEYKEINIDNMNPYCSIKILEKPVTLKQLKEKYDLPF